MVSLGLALVIALGGCAGMTQKERDYHRHYVTEKVSPGMPVAEAIQVFAKDGYTCKDRGDRAECTRYEEGLLKGCRYDVVMHVNTKLRIVTKSVPGMLCVRKYP